MEDIEESKNEILSAIYEYRENEGGIITPKFNKSIKILKENNNEYYNEILNLIKENICDNSILVSILEKINDYEEIKQNEIGYYYEQYYKVGFLDGLHLMNEKI